MTKIETPKKSLVTISRFVSPVYSFQYRRTVEEDDVDRPDWHIYSDPPEIDNLQDWMKENALHVVKEPFPEHCSPNDRGYLIIGRNGTHNVLYQESTTLKPKAWGVSKNIEYRIDLTIKTQPADDLPVEISDALDLMGYQRVESFELRK